MTKSDRQQLGIYRYLQKGAIGTLEYVPRFGKTRVGLMIIDRFNKKNIGKCLVVVPSIAIVNAWNNEKKLYEKEVLHEIKFDIITAQSTITNDKYELLIIDEIHKFTSPDRIKFVIGDKIKYKYLLGLTGTYDYNNNILKKYAPVIDTINEEEAIREGWISKYDEYNIKLELSDNDKLKYDSYSKVMSNIYDIFKDTQNLIYYNNIKVFKSPFEVIMGCFHGVKIGNTYVKAKTIREIISMKMGYKEDLDSSNKYYANIIKYWSTNAIRNNARLYYTNMKARNNLLKFNDVKLNAVLLLYTKFRNNNIICFNESIEFADIITQSINNTYKSDEAISYHSKIKGVKLIDFTTGKYFTKRDGNVKTFGQKSVLKYIIEMFKIGKYKIINTVNALDEGLNIPNLNIAISTAGTLNPLQYKQRSARVKTIDIGSPNKPVIIINLFFDDFTYYDKEGNKVDVKSRDKSKLLERQEYKYIETYTLEEFLNKEFNI